ncbi:EXS family [Carpediemonas membranifera]|uniref:EXS family n=1 Tax=Carpediemonas membranifera TaxID=201153 RepID=A0A8J6AZU1_9EUKA|nr:EXS family [Carpediemonas membranifera]|eukprot:KAG9391219.1 EXS family [Carpediemonas membranifera]
MPTIEVPIPKDSYGSESSLSSDALGLERPLLAAGTPLTPMGVVQEGTFIQYPSYWKYVRQIRVKRTDSFKLGLSLGTLAALLIATLTNAFNPPIMALPAYYVSAPIFYANLMFFSPILCWALVLFFFERHSIPFHIVLDLKGRLITSVQVFKNALVLANLWLSSFFLFTLGTRHHITLHLLGLCTIRVPSTIFTAVNYASLLIYVWPFHGFHRSSRRVIIKDLASFFLGPFAVPIFRRTMLADITTSLVIPLRMFAEGTCLVFTGGLFTFTATTRMPVCITLAPLLSDVVSIVPYLWRFIQCLSQCFRKPVHRERIMPSLNAVKYLTCIVAVAVSGTIGVFENAGMVPWDWVVAVNLILVIISTAYCYIWDIFADWGMISFEGGRIRLRECLYPGVLPYILIPLANIPLRFAWALTLTPHGLWPYPQTLNLVLGLLEILRRFMWVAFRGLYFSAMIEKPGKAHGQIATMKIRRQRELHTMIREAQSTERLPLLDTIDMLNAPNTPIISTPGGVYNLI